MDPIADMFTIIRNGYAVNKETVSVPCSKLKMEIAKLLQREGYLKDVIRRGKKSKRNFELVLAYNAGRPAITHVRRMSKPSHRVYVSFRKAFQVRNSRGIKILSTSAGLLTDKEAREKKVGGEVMAEIW